MLIYYATLVTQYLTSFLGTKENLDSRTPTSFSLETMESRERVLRTACLMKMDPAGRSSAWQERYEAGGVCSRDNFDSKFAASVKLR